MSEESPVRRFQDFRWQQVDLLAYKQEGDAPFKDITRQVLFQFPDLDGELRYFEMAPGGHSTLERHQHRHAVMILRGHGRCLVKDKVFNVGPNDLVDIAALSWHQFKADAGEPLGFLCLVNVLRDKPQLPTESDLAELRRLPGLSAFLTETC
ncbi:MAG: cupin domain-containing protein [Rhodospirillales bacterium]|jgi:mannose-6-phosphate isomerase-like protein (cupin superfamily)|nr:cupin domain-containing protein [Rhodospirillales bacterium]